MTRDSEPSRDGSFIGRLSRAVGADVDPEVILDDAEAQGREADAQSSAGTSSLLARMQSRPSISSRYRLEGEIARGGMGAIREV